MSQKIQEHPKPPKRPLTPYMRFSKSSWQSVKAVNPTLTVCEIGSTIGKMWRALTDVEKKVYNDGFLEDKKTYEGTLAEYMKTTGLTISEIYKKGRKKDSRKTANQLAIKDHVRSALMGAKSAKNARMDNNQTQPYQRISSNMSDTQLQINPQLVQSMGGRCVQNQEYMKYGQGHQMNGQSQNQNYSPYIVQGFNPNSQYQNGRQMMYLPNGVQQNWNEQIPHFAQIWSNQSSNSQETTQQQSTNQTQNMVPINQNYVVQSGYQQNLAQTTMSQNQVYIQPSNLVRMQRQVQNGQNAANDGNYVGVSQNNVPQNYSSSYYPTQPRQAQYQGMSYANQTEVIQNVNMHNSNTQNQQSTQVSQNTIMPQNPNLRVQSSQNWNDVKLDNNPNVQLENPVRPNGSKIVTMNTMQALPARDYVYPSQTQAYKPAICEASSISNVNQNQNHQNNTNVNHTWNNKDDPKVDIYTNGNDQVANSPNENCQN